MTTGDVIRVGQIEIRFRLQGAQTGGNVAMFDYRIPVGARVPVAHSHEAFDETLYGLAGITDVTLDGRKTELGPDDVLFIPRGHVHQVENAGRADARGLSVLTPGLLGPGFFHEIAQILAAGGPPDVRRVEDVMRHHGMRPAHQPN